MPDSVKVSEYFTRAATSFDSLYADESSDFDKFINRRFRRDIYERFASSLSHALKSKSASVLDVGCGPGRYAIALAELGVQRIVGLDISEGMIALAKQRTATERPDDKAIEFICQSFMDLGDSERFDLVIAMGFFDYIADPLPVLARMKSLATHSVIASFPSISWYRTPIRKVRYFFKRCPVYFYRRDQIEQLGKAAGFTKTEVSKIDGAGQDYFVTFYK